MNPHDRERVKELLAQAAGLDIGRRRSYIEENAADSAVAREALDLLKTLDDSDFLAAVTGAGIPAPSTAPALEGPGTQIGRYKLLQQIGEGGFGTVFMAEQVEPVMRRVALKIIKPGMDTRQVIARFEAERQALAMMDHPNIARVLDAGATAAGRPFFVMELVRGEPVTRYCDRNQLGVEERLSLFQDICGAVQHAHQKGIIHRDIKPSNVMVTVADGRPLPKVIDFGIAKATAMKLTDKTLFTEIHQLIGTPQYMSPEQAEVAGVDVDTRSDLYSLGVLLYELLAGSPPFDVARLRSASIAEIQRIIRDEEPPRPSVKLRTLAASSNIAALPRESTGIHHSDDSAIDIARRRRTEPMLLARRLKGDLDWIVMKCLEKNRARRYETAAALADDISRYLAREPVTAMPPSAGYKLRKFVQRHRGAMLAGGAVALTLVGATGVSIVFAIRASRALGLARTSQALAEKRADETRQVARFQSDLLAGIDVQAMGHDFKELFREKVKDSLSRQFVGEWPDRRKLTEEEIAAHLADYDRVVGPAQAVDVARDVLDKYILGNDIDAVKSRFADQPAVQADLLYTLGILCRTLGLHDKSEAALQRALELQLSLPEPDELARADAESELSGALSAQDRHGEAEQLRRDALATYRAHYGELHPKTITGTNMLALALYNQGKHAESEALLREALALARQLPPADHAVLAQVLNDLGGALHARDQVQEAEPLIRESLDIRRRLLGDEHKEVADSLNNLAGIHYSRGDFDGAWELLEQSLDIKRKLLGDESVEIATLLNNLASIKYREKDYATAKTIYADALDMYRRILGDEHNEVVGTLNNLAMIYKFSGESEESEPMLREALDIRRRIRGPDHPEVALSIANLALQREDQGDLKEAEKLFREAVAINHRQLPANHTWRITSDIGLMRMLLADKRLDEMETFLKQAYDELQKAPAADDDDRNRYIQCFIRLYQERHEADPGKGHDQTAAQWQEKADALSPQPNAD